MTNTHPVTARNEAVQNNTAGLPGDRFSAVIARTCVFARLCVLSSSRSPLQRKSRPGTVFRSGLLSFPIGARACPKATDILTTAYSEYALEGFRLQVVDNLLKPITFKRFYQAALKAQQTFQERELAQDTTKENQSPFLYVKQNDGFQKIIWNNILYVESMENYVKISSLWRIRICILDPVGEQPDNNNLID